MVTTGEPPSFTSGQWLYGRVSSGGKSQKSPHPPILLAGSVVFLDFSSAVAILYRDLLDLHVLNLLRSLRIRNGTEILSIETDVEHFQRLYQRLDQICHYCEYFFEDDKKFTGRILFFMSFQVALLALPDLVSFDHNARAESEVALRVRTVCQYLELQGFQPWHECNSRWTRFINLSGLGPGGE
jgi:hypothetical protein